MFVAMSSWSYREWFDSGRCDLLSFLDEAARLGVDAVEVFPRHVDADDPADHVRRACAKAAKLALRVSSLIAGNDFAQPTAAARAGQVDAMKRWIDVAAQNDVPVLNTFTGYHRDGQDPQMEVARVVDAYREVAPLAEQAGVLLAIENHSTVAPDADGLLAIIRAVGSDAVRTNPDFTNFVADYQLRPERARRAIYTESAKVVPLAANAHIKVSDYTDDGDHAYVDVPRLLGMLADASYDGAIVVELAASGDPVAPCEQAVAMLRRALGD